MRRHVLLACLGVTILLTGCATSHKVPFTFAAYETSGAVVLDGERGTNEWTDAERCSGVDGVFGKGKWEGGYYQRHYVWCMYDNNWFYLMVRTFCSDTNTILVHFPGDQPCDGFTVAISSEDKVVLSTKILQNGTAMPLWLNWARMPQKQDWTTYVAQFGLEMTTSTRPDGHEWTTEMKMPLPRLKVLGRRVSLEVSGKNGRLHFYPKKCTTERTENGS